MRHNLNYIQQTGMPRFRGFNLLQKFRYDNGGKAVVFKRANMPYLEEDFALIRELGQSPDREWMLYVQSPREDRKAVEVKVPGFGDVAVDVTRSGCFYHLQEGKKDVLRVGLEPK
jgi:hypothetical protein